MNFVGAQPDQVPDDLCPVALSPDGEYAIPQGCILEIGVFPVH